MHYVSPSQLKTFRLCPRKWWFSRHVDRTPDTPAQKMGTEIHELLEDYLKTGVPIKGEELTHKVARTMVPLLPHPSEVCNGDVERDLEFTPEGWPIPIKCRVDLVEVTNRRVTDAKTTKEWRHCLTEDNLRQDPQSIMYCSGTGMRTFRHVYGRTKELKRGIDPAREVSVTYAKGELESLLAEMLPEVQTMLSYHDLPASDVPKAPDTSACFQYGRCPHASRCYQASNPTLAAAEELLSLL